MPPNDATAGPPPDALVAGAGTSSVALGSTEPKLHMPKLKTGLSDMEADIKTSLWESVHEKVLTPQFAIVTAVFVICEILIGTL